MKTSAGASKGRKVRELEAARKRRTHDIVFYTAFAVYLAVLAGLLFFKGGGRVGDTRTVNLVPFRFVADYILGDNVLSFSNVAGNILMFLPMGVFLPFIGRERPWYVHLARVALISLAAEVMQYLLGRGAADVDDIILNTLGGLIGIACYQILRRIFGEKTRAAVEVAAIAAGALFIAVYLCLYYGVFGIYIRI